MKWRMSTVSRLLSFKFSLASFSAAIFWVLAMADVLVARSACEFDIRALLALSASKGVREKNP